jgi:cell division septation protein DedD
MNIRKLFFISSFLLLFCPLAVSWAATQDTYSEIETYKKAIKADPDDADAHYKLGVLYIGLERYTEAIEAFEELIRVKPGNAEALKKLDEAKAKRMLAQEAIKAFDILLADPDNAPAHYSLGIYYIDRNDMPAAMDEYEALKNLDTELAADLFTLLPPQKQVPAVSEKEPREDAGEDMQKEKISPEPIDAFKKVIVPKSAREDSIEPRTVATRIKKPAPAPRIPAPEPIDAFQKVIVPKSVREESKEPETIATRIKKPVPAPRKPSLEPVDAIKKVTVPKSVRKDSKEPETVATRLKKTAPPKKPPVMKKNIFSVQVGAFKVKKNALALVERLKQKGYDAFTHKEEQSQKEPFHRVLIGKFEKRSSALELSKIILTKEDMKSFIYLH